MGMAAGNGTPQSLRKVIASLKDSTKVGLVNLNSDNKGVDIAIVKATNHDEVLPKEKHINTILAAVSASRPRADVAYCIQGLAKRLAKTRSWTVALKTLIVIHRALREVDHSFCQELINYSRGRSLILNLSHFRDDSTTIAWDYSSWVRMYALYLQEQVECFRLMRYDIEKSGNKTKRLSTQDLLEQLPSLQQLLYRLLGCKPEGVALSNSLIRYALSIVASESVKLYVSVTNGILNLVDKFFEMPSHDALRTLEIYRKAENQADNLTELFEICRGLEFGRGQMYIKIEKHPASFMAAMEDYVKDAPHSLLLQHTAIDGNPPALPIEGPKIVAHSEADLSTDKQNPDVKEDSDQPVTTHESARSHQSEAVATQQVIGQTDHAAMQQITEQRDIAATDQITDLLGLEEITQQPSELDGINSLALAIAAPAPENPPHSGNNLNTASQAMDWELALVTAASSNGAAIAQSKLAGGLDKLTLDSLYEAAMTTRVNQNGTNMGQMSSNPFKAAACLNQDPFSASSSTSSPTNVQKADMIQQQNLLAQQQRVNGQHLVSPSGNPFVD